MSSRRSNEKTLDAKGMIMRRLNLTLVVAALVSTISAASAADWSAQYSPTRKEWLELSLSKRIADVTDLWERRIGVGVAVFPSEKIISIVLAAANGQESLSSTNCANYIGVIRKIADGHIKKYGWAKGAAVEIRCA